MNKGLIHTYCGDGKGKTTCAIGLAVRCAGADMHVLFTQFLKSSGSSERKILSSVSNLELMDIPEEVPFVFRMTTEEKQYFKDYYDNLFFESIKKVSKGNYDMLVLDEILPAVSCGMVDREEVLKFLGHKPSHLEIVMTGRTPPVSFLEISDYISEIKSRKHPFESGTQARRGIEY